MIETSTIESIYYLLKKIGNSGIEKLKLVKLIYLADKYHLIRYGRTITNDKYYAMKDGPAGTTVKDVLGLEQDYLSVTGYDYALRLLKIDGKKLKALDVEIDFEMLSETDIEALDFIIDKFSHMSATALRNYTHRYPEWNQHESQFKNANTKREELDTEELLSQLEDDPLGMPEDHVEESRNILTGIYV
ncbi:MAG: Panacea domain-containing protein [Candidatus Anammoxibacter sp.]